MAILASLQGQGGGRIPMPNGLSYDLSRHELARIIEAMPTEACRAMHVAARTGDIAAAQRLIREAAASYFATTPAAPVVAPVAPAQPTRPSRRNPHGRMY